jgi:Ca2+-binding RTX toxin-like protein
MATKPLAKPSNPLWPDEQYGFIADEISRAQLIMPRPIIDTDKSNLVAGTNGNDVILGNGGNDTILGFAGNDYLKGGDGDDSLLGHDGNDSLFGDLGNDYLNGGFGSDTLMGGLGNDTYEYNGTSTTIVEKQNEGTDTVLSYSNYALGENLENLRMQGNANLTGTGNALNNVLTGNSGKNILAGGAGNDTLDGGWSADTLNGGTGNDTYYVDFLDTVVEKASEGIDEVNSSGSYKLGNNLENLKLLGRENVEGIGNSLDNMITGNDGRNVLTGDLGNDTLDGGLGRDTLVGGMGNDSYIINSTEDTIFELDRAGTDTVLSSVFFRLSNNLENLTLTGTSNIDGFGSDVNNTLTGNQGNNVLGGGFGDDTLFGGAGSDRLYGDFGNDFLTGGAGKDILFGGGGADTFVLNSLKTDDSDTILDFSKGDKIALDKSVFTYFKDNAVTISDTLPTGDKSTLYFNSAEKNLYYIDAQNLTNVPAQKFLIARFEAPQNIGLTAQDFTVIG